MKTNNKRDGFDLCLERYLGHSNQPHAELVASQDTRVVFSTDGFLRIYTPERKVWSGEGLPPVGAVCEITTNDGYNWRPVKIIFSDDYVVIVGDADGVVNRELFKRCDADIYFRPVRPPEQIAPDELEKAVLEIAHILISNRASCAEYHQARLIYDAGYRKEVKS